MRVFDTAVSALHAISTAQSVTAHNIANVNTQGFDPSRTVFEERGDMGGVAVQDISAPQAQGPLIPTLDVFENAEGMMQQSRALAEGSATNLATEMVSMISNQHAFAANAAVVSTQDEMIGSLLDSFA